MTAQWKAATDREALQIGPELPKPPATNAPTPTSTPTAKPAQPVDPKTPGQR
jgi:hypothetical protein